MSKTATKTKPSLWKRIVARIKAQASHGTGAGQWSGRKAQAAVKAYKKAGGGYKGGGKSQTSLAKWSKQKWRTKSAIYHQKLLKIYHQQNMPVQLQRKEKIKLVVNSLASNQKV